MNVYRYETEQNVIETLTGPTIFLGGPTVRGHQPHLTSWRGLAIQELEKQGFTGNVIAPEFTSKSESDKGKVWVPLWEFAGLKRADCILFWIPRTRELIGLTTNFEIGYWIGRERRKVVYGRPDDAYRIGYVDIMWNADYEENERRYEDKSIHKTLADTIGSSIARADGRYYEKHEEYASSSN